MDQRPIIAATIGAAVTQPSAELRLLNSTFDQNYPGLLEQKCMIDTKLWSACKAIIWASHTLPLLILLPPSTQLFLLVFLLTALHWRGAINFLYIFGLCGAADCVLTCTTKDTTSSLYCELLFTHIFDLAKGLFMNSATGFSLQHKQ